MGFGNYWKHWEEEATPGDELFEALVLLIAFISLFALLLYGAIVTFG